MKSSSSFLLHVSSMVWCCLCTSLLQLVYGFTSPHHILSIGHPLHTYHEHLNEKLQVNQRRTSYRCSGTRTLVITGASNKKSGKSYDQSGEVGKGPNWIEKSFPVDTTGDEEINPKKVDDYNLGISGISFQTGSLSKRMFDTIVSKTSLDMSPEIEEAFRLYAMDFTAKEATRAALKQNGLDMALMEEEEDQGMWGDVDTVRLIDTATGIPFSNVYDSLEDAVKQWEPGQTFDFVVRQVPAKIRELSMEELLQALDPDGKLRDEAEQLRQSDKEDAENPNANDDSSTISSMLEAFAEEDLSADEAMSAIFDDEDITSLADLATDNMKRTEQAPRGATTEATAFAGLDKRGYSVINRSNLLRDSINADGTENHATTMHVMDALVSHGVLLVDLTDGGLTSFNNAKVMADMWSAAEQFFDHIEKDETAADQLPGLTTVMETGSQHAKVGYVSYDSGSMKFLETRRERKTGTLLPKGGKVHDMLGTNGISALQNAFDLVASVGKDVIRIATAASSVEHGAFVSKKSSADTEIDERDQKIRASQAAALLADELVDNGRPLETTKIDNNEGTVSMSPHRLCSYSDKRQDDQEEDGKKTDLESAREVFGAHTDASFVTAVPVAAVSGLEVYDEAAEQWYRPELKAREHWELEQKDRGNDPSSTEETVEVDGRQIKIPWHARYVAIMAGEHLQLATRNEVSSGVHRVVAAKGHPARLSAPILLRGRPGTKFLAKRYWGGTLGNPLLQECDGKSMEEIHDATQPSSYQ